MLNLMCTVWITLIVNGSPVATKVAVPAKLVNASAIRYMVDTSQAMTRFPNRDKEVNYAKMLVYKSQCIRL